MSQDTRSKDELAEAHDLLRDVRSFLADIAGDYDLTDHAFTHVLLNRFTERIDALTERT